ncbi:hypothetical protein Pmani_022797 [Petrolisthes manimaculis]|uniref:Uncharacterized protein n=1 Tax=Petrolisthes manimaculis TaxID=1843537 RepID=A0AAE1PBF5_9EUCA|nr:hypothetical protein Pmani_022797 [Petrolisthes manimaculis]
MICPLLPPTHTHTHTRDIYSTGIMSISVGTSVGIGLSVGILLLLLLASLFYNLYLRLRLKRPDQQPVEEGGGGAEGNGGVPTSETGHYRGNITDTTQIVSRSRSPGPYTADNQAIRVTPSRVLEKKKSNSSAVSHTSTIPSSIPNSRKVSNVSAKPITPSRLPGKDQSISPSASNLQTENIYANVVQENTHYINITGDRVAVTGAQGLPQDYQDDEQNIYEDIS